jgi:hypothetical protein
MDSLSPVQLACVTAARTTDIAASSETLDAMPRDATCQDFS